MKQSSTGGSRITSKPIISKQKEPKKQRESTYLQLNNQQFLRRNIILLGVNEPTFLKETKCSLEGDLFPKSMVNPTSSKTFFFISFFCLQCMTNNEQISSLKMWFPPRNVNQQIQYKKCLFKTIQNLQLIGRIPKNIIISKGTIMGDSSSGALIQFLRFISEMALRYQYLEKYSQKQRLIQISCNSASNFPQGNINNFYLYPFVPSSTVSQFQHLNLDLQNLEQVYTSYLKIYFKKLLSLKTESVSPVLLQPYQNLMKNYLSQKQLNDTLSKKVPKAMLSQNRAFDRRRLVDRNEQIWKQLNQLELNYVDQKQIPVLRLEGGEIDQLLKKWQPQRGITKINEAIAACGKIQQMKKDLEEKRIQFRSLCQKISQQLLK